MDSHIRKVLDEIGGVLNDAGPEAVCALADAVSSAERVYVYGLGRTGLMCRAFAMRLMHMGLAAHAVGEATAPAIGPGDMLIACSGSGTTAPVVAAAQKAVAAGARVAAVTGAADTPLAQAACPVAVLPFRPEQRPPGGQFGGSAFEQALLIFLDAAVLELMQRLGQTHENMAARHANLP